MIKSVPYTMADFKQDTFYKYPKWLFHDPDLGGLPAKAKSLYMYMLNLNSLSFKHADDYTDEQGEIFFICTRASMQELLNCGYNQPRIYVELLKRHGLIREKRTGCNRPNRLYLLRPETPFEKQKKPQKDPCNPHKHRIHSLSVSGCTDEVHPDTPLECILHSYIDLPDIERGGGGLRPPNQTPPQKTCTGDYSRW